MSKRPYDVSDSDNPARLPIHDLLSPNEHEHQGPVKKPRNFIASVVCAVPALRLLHHD